MTRRRRVRKSRDQGLLLDPEARRARNREIRERIAANRARRLAIADAMKREAGVREHHVWGIERGGLAYAAVARIHSPEGRNIRQLYIVAHECGHVFLHGGELEVWMAPHIKEMEAESYAHQAFRMHGMEMPKEISLGGRRYVASWIERDRKSGLPIDPRVVAYVNGLRSPYEPLRRVPQTWLPPMPEPPPGLHEPQTQPMQPASWWRRLIGRPERVREQPAPPVWTMPAPAPARPRETVSAVLSVAWHSTVLGMLLALGLMDDMPLPGVGTDLLPAARGYRIPIESYYGAFGWGLVFANMTLMLRTMVR